jgi:ribonuclease Z
MTPIFHPQLVNDPFGDPVLYIDFKFSRRALLFDLGDIRALPARKLLRLTHIFVSHTHMDHFIGFDHLLRLCIGRQKSLALFGPAGFIAQVEHRLAGYTWNLVQGYDTDLTLDVTEVQPGGRAHRARFRCHTRFQREDRDAVAITDGILLDEDMLRVRSVELDHRIPCLAFALEEKQHINVWKNQLATLALPTGPWLNALKTAVRRGEPDTAPFAIHWHDHAGTHERVLPLGTLKADILHIVPGQKIAYVVDAIGHAHNAHRILDLAHAADSLFIEAMFLHADAGRAADKYHLTARQAGWLARTAGVKHLIPMHFSPRYSDDPQRLRQEAEAEFAGTGTSADTPIFPMQDRSNL